MSNLYTVQFKDSTNYAELYTHIPILCVHTCQNKNNKLNKILFYEFIINKNIKYIWNELNLEITLKINNKYYSFIFDTKEKFDQFKYQLDIHTNSEFEIKYYNSGNIKYIGQINNEENMIENVNGVIFYDLPDYKVKYIGEFFNGTIDGCGLFYDKTGMFNLKVNNISNGLPIESGELYINYVDEKNIDIDFFNIWDKLDLFDNNSKIEFVMSDIFLDDLVNIFYDIDELLFNNKSLDDKLITLWNMLYTINNNYEKYNKEINNNMNITVCLHILICFFVNIIIINLIILKKE